MLGSPRRDPSALNEFPTYPLLSFGKLELSSRGAACIFYEGIMAPMVDGCLGVPIPLIRHCPLDLIRRWPPLFFFFLDKEISALIKQYTSPEDEQTVQFNAGLMWS